MKTLLLLSLLFTQAVPRSTLADYAVGPDDVLMITVVGESDLTAKYTVGQDGTFDFPWIGRVHAQGLTLRALEDLIVKRLVEGKFLIRPQVTVQIQEFRSQSVYVMGEVKAQGPYRLTGATTIVDLLSQAVMEPTAGDEILINRRKGQQEPTGPVLGGDQSDVEVIHLAKKDVFSGRAGRLVTLKDGDTIVVPRASPVFVTGQVRSAGSYPFASDLTVLKALALAGGPTERAATSRIKILRTVNGKQKEIKVKLSDLVQPGDTITVPSKWM